VKHALAQALRYRGAAGLDLGPYGRIDGRLRAPGTDDVVVSATRNGNNFEFAAPEGPATIESDPAVRNMLLWGRRPADFTRWHSNAGPQGLAPSSGTAQRLQIEQASPRY
jgi:hypothetical protein